MISEIFLRSEKIFNKIFVSGNKNREKILKDEGLVNILSPGRINIIGEHTDYNLGLSLAMAIDKYKFFTGMKNYTEKVEIYDKGFDQYYEFSLDNIFYDENIKWANYIKGILKEYLINGNKISGFSILIDSNLPSGSGLSSSAAILAGAAQIMEELFKLKNPKKDILNYCHNAENNFVRVNNGFLDHFAVLFGKKDKAIFLNFRDLSYSYVPLNLKDYFFLIIDSKEERFLPETDYNKRHEECNLALEKIIHITGNKKLKSISEIDYDLLNSLKNKLPDYLFRRVKHVITENNRVIMAKEYLEKDDFESLGLLLTDSHKSLSNDYEVSTEKLNFLVNTCDEVEGVPGARLMGAGFGGCIIALVRSNTVKELMDIITETYYKKFKLCPEFLICNSSNGAMLFEKE